MTGTSIDLNCDLGEDPQRIRDGTDLALLGLVTSANIACGGHAGDEFTMTETVRGAIERGVAVGAHPGYPDRAGFGRLELDLSPDQVEDTVLEQIRTLDGVARSLGTRLVHVKPHGALYHAAMTRPAVSQAIARAVGRVDAGLILVGLAGAPALEAWQKLGFHTLPEAFADRRYEPDGSLRSRTLPGALIDDPGASAEQALRIASGKGVVASDGTVILLSAGTLCVHSDTPGAPGVALAVRDRLEGAGITVAPLVRS